MKKFIAALLLLSTSLVALADPIIPGSSGVITHSIGDDGYAVVPLQFGFPFYGRTFTHSFMFDNGVVGFYDPTANAGCNPQNNYCGGQQWSAPSPNTNMGQQFSYTIAPLWADIAPNPSTKYYTQGTNEYQRYMWENIHEFYSGGSRLNTFGLELTPTGSIDAYYSLVNINSSNTFVGTIGNPAAGEWNTIGYYPYGTVLNQMSNWSMAGTGANPCVADPLSSASCPGYAQAYLTQQCSINALYNPSCPGYAEAYFIYQCTANSLYNPSCPGYAAAYLEYQCSIDPLYSTSCSGYEQAYYNQQCSLNPLYNSGCPSYEQAYYTYKCSLNTLYDSGCPGYEQAYHNQQCSLNQLYSTSCSGYAQAYYNQQCSLNGLYDRNCPNYAEAYAIKNVVTKPSIAEPVQQNITIIASNTNNTTSQVAIVADPVVNNTITTTTTTTSPATAAPVVTLVVAPPTASSLSTSAVAKESSSSEKKQEKTETTNKQENNSKSSSSGTKPSQQSAREQIVAKRKEEAMQSAVKAGAEAAEKMDTATSLAAQIAVQNVVIAAMGYTPGFQAYSYMIPDGNGYKPFSIYKNQKTVDNKRLTGGLLGASDRLHEQMINQQYKQYGD